MHKASIRYAIDLNNTWNLSKEDIIDLRTGICSRQFQKKLSEEDKVTQFHGCRLRNVYVKCDTNELVFIIEPDWTSKSIGLISVIEPNNDFFEKYLYENIVLELIELGRISNANLSIDNEDKSDWNKNNKENFPYESLAFILPFPMLDLTNTEQETYICPHHNCKITYAIKKGHIDYCPKCNQPISISGTNLVSIKEDDMNDGN